MVQLVFFGIASFGVVFMAAVLVALCRSSRTRFGLFQRLCQLAGLSPRHVRLTPSTVHKITSAEPAPHSNGNILVMRGPDPTHSSKTESTERLRKAR
jgi:hypothetical protein